MSVCGGMHMYIKTASEECHSIYKVICDYQLFARLVVVRQCSMLTSSKPVQNHMSKLFIE